MQALERSENDMISFEHLHKYSIESPLSKDILGVTLYIETHQ